MKLLVTKFGWSDRVANKCLCSQRALSANFSTIGARGFHASENRTCDLPINSRALPLGYTPTEVWLAMSERSESNGGPDGIRTHVPGLKSLCPGPD